MYRYKILHHLPSVPDHLINEAYDTLRTSTKDTTINSQIPNYTQRILQKNGKSFAHTYTKRFDLSVDFKKWIEENIVSSWTECTISRTQSHIANTQGPHTDKTRSYVLMYVLDSGGDNCETVWYQEKGKPYLREARQLLMVDDYSLLEKKESVKLPIRVWSIIATDYLHSVENIERDRIALHIGLLTDEGIK